MKKMNLKSTCVFAFMIFFTLVDAFAVTDEEISQAYLDYFGRSPDAEGAKYWKASGLSASDLKSAFVQSEEYRAKISTLYNEVLQRDPDTEGVNFWVNSKVTIAEVRAGLSTSAEFTQNRLAKEAAGGPRWGYVCDDLTDRNERYQCESQKCHGPDGRIMGNIEFNQTTQKTWRCPNRGCELTSYKLPDFMKTYEGSETAKSIQTNNIPVYTCPKGTATTDTSVHLVFDGGYYAKILGTIAEYKEKMANQTAVAVKNPAPVSAPVAQTSLEAAFKELIDPTKNSNPGGATYDLFGTNLPGAEEHDLFGPSRLGTSVPAGSDQQDVEFINGIKSFAFNCLTAESPSALCKAMPKVVEMGTELLMSEVGQTAQNATSVKYYTSGNSDLQSNTTKSHRDVLATSHAADLQKYDILKLSAADVGTESLSYGRQTAGQMTQQNRTVLSTSLNTYSASKRLSRRMNMRNLASRVKFNIQ